MVLILTEPLGLHSSPVREEREVVISGLPTHTHTPCFRTSEGDETASRHGFLQDDVCRGQAQPYRTASSGNSHLGSPPPTSSCLSALTETMNSPTGTPRRTVVPVGTALAVRDSGWMKHQTPTAWLFQSGAWHGKRVRSCVLSSSGASSSLPPRGL